ncbi:MULTISPECIES: hypothetical protein [Micromonospora]|uniref:Uncharacterized protein n=1 Tax=Micromonospora solifontis TaxID=2487138 RepID=A0ABX9WBU1_9ACTN|nr:MULTISPECIES: hypothetical protein [Micromonospora]NES16056.1 hypothetical protein [Micromonospora sp. PPF5-17B]NES38676.1 hypothetical protein [Micromonospora solifontis]NES57408.1 hypothetical protein [Micromonospora sp. PPF5-6]RNL93981.1 hypothetical protein EFE23_21410 [Micromonospora solifontis]
MRGLVAHRARSAVLSVLGLVAAFVLMTVAPARAGENVFVEVTPNPAQAGTRVSIRANCDNANNRQAEVNSDAFGRVMLRPDNGFLTGAVTIPSNKPAGDYPVDLRCSNGNTASTTLTVLNMASPSKGPATGGGGTAGSGRGTGSLLLVGGLVAVAVVAGVGARRRTGSRF